MRAVYGIFHKDSDTFYVGSSIDVGVRFRHHRYLLRHNRHTCAYLQNAWNKHGEASFEFRVIEESVGTFEDLRRLEQSYLDKHWGGLYNSMKTVDIGNIWDSTDRRVRMAESLRNSDSRKRWAAEQSGEYPSLTGPDGTVYPAGTNLRAFCREHGLSFGNIYCLIRGLYRGKLTICVTGWTLTEPHDYDELRRQRQALTAERYASDEYREWRRSQQREGSERVNLGEQIRQARLREYEDPANREKAKARLALTQHLSIAAVAISYPAFVDPDGVVHAPGVNLRAFIKSHGIRGEGNFRRMVQGHHRTCEGWRLATEDEASSV
jgi:hypothetical protein